VTSPVAVEPAPAEACSACNGALDALGRCSKCGAVFGEAYRCPLCHAVSDVEASPTLYYRCRTCGGPRVPPAAGPSSERETALLKQARAEQLRAGAFRVGSAFALASGLLSLLVTNVVLLATSPPGFAKFAALFASAVPVLLAVLAFRSSAAHQKKLDVALQQAWLSAAGRVAARAGGQISAASLAQTLGIAETRAELLLAELSVQDFIEPSALPSPSPKVRVTELADPAELADQAASATSNAVEIGTSKR
jgi:hypothetical protein